MSLSKPRVALVGSLTAPKTSVPLAAVKVIGLKFLGKEVNGLEPLKRLALGVSMIHSTQLPAKSAPAGGSSPSHV